MKIILSLLLLTVASASADVGLIDNDKTLTVDCAKDKEVSLIGNHLTITLVGQCTKLSVIGNHESVTGSVTTTFVAGNHNSLALDAIEAVTVAGTHNVVSWKTSPAKGGPSISNTGTDNAIKQRK